VTKDWGELPQIGLRLEAMARQDTHPPWSTGYGTTGTLWCQAKGCLKAAGFEQYYKIKEWRIFGLVSGTRSPLIYFHVLSAGRDAPAPRQAGRPPLRPWRSALAGPLTDCHAHADA